MTDPYYAWLCRWPDGELLVFGGTIEDARLAARRYAGNVVAVTARLATSVEMGDPERNRKEPA